MGQVVRISLLWGNFADREVLAMDENDSEARGIPLTLRERYVAGKVVLFVGAGLSIRSGAPGWKQLLTGLLARFKQEMVPLAYEKELQGLIDKGSPNDFLWIMEYLRSVRTGLIGDYVREVCGHLPPQTVHRQIGKLKCPGIITTNFDDLLESAVRHEKGQVNVIVPYNLEGLAKLEDRSPWVLKLHGTFEDSGHTVFSRSDYELLEMTDSVAATLGHLFQRYTILFLGYGLRDQDMLQQFSYLRFVFREHQRTHYALMEESSIEDFRAEVLADLYNIQIMKYSNVDGSHDEVTTFITKLLGCEAGKGPLSLPMLLFVVTKRGSSATPGPMLLVKKHYGDMESERDEARNRPYLLPSLTDIGYSEEQLVEAGLRVVGRGFGWFKREDFSLKIDGKVFQSKKVSRCLGEEVLHEIRFVEVELKPEILKRLESIEQSEGGVRIGAHVFEWQPIEKLRKHAPTKKLNGDVIDEVERRVKAKVGT